jgi:uncharacterized protein YcbX
VVTSGHDGSLPGPATPYPCPVPLTLGAIHRYPVKSCRGAQVPSAVVEPWGLAGDRRWLVTDAEGRFRTAREVRQLLLVAPTLRPDGGLSITAPGAPDLEVDVPSGRPLLPVTVWSSRLDAMTVDPAADAWFTEVLGSPSRLVHLDDPTRRLPSQTFARPTDRVSFADGYPLLVTTSASLAALNELIAGSPRADQGPLPMTRFRPNLVVDGGTAWDEDGWRLLRVGDAVFRAVKGCARCAITMTDPATLERRPEPIATLARHRRWDGETWFGMNLVPDTPGATINLQDEVEILDAVSDPDGPPR